MEEQKSPCVLQDFILFGAAALLPRIPIYRPREAFTGLAAGIWASRLRYGPGCWGEGGYEGEEEEGEEGGGENSPYV